MKPQVFIIFISYHNNLASYIYIHDISLILSCDISLFNIPVIALLPGSVKLTYRMGLLTAHKFNCMKQIPVFIWAELIIAVENGKVENQYSIFEAISQIS